MSMTDEETVEAFLASAVAEEVTAMYHDWHGYEDGELMLDMGFPHDVYQDFVCPETGLHFEHCYHGGLEFFELRDPAQTLSVCWRFRQIAEDNGFPEVVWCGRNDLVSFSGNLDGLRDYLMLAKLAS